MKSAVKFLIFEDRPPPDGFPGASRPKRPALTLPLARLRPTAWSEEGRGERAVLSIRPKEEALAERRLEIVQPGGVGIEFGEEGP